MPDTSCAQPSTVPFGYTATSYNIRMSTSKSTSDLSQDPTIASGFTRRKLHRLPRTDEVSYFPPFESMGSAPVSEQSTTTPYYPMVSTFQPKGHSLGSLANILSWIAPPNIDTLTEGKRLYSDEEAVTILTKRCGTGKRLVLEPLSMGNANKTGEPRSSKGRRVEACERNVRAIVETSTMKAIATSRDAHIKQVRQTRVE